MEQNINRRKFLGGLAAVGAASMLGGIGKMGAGEAKAESYDPERSKQYYPFMSKQATVVDFGLSKDQEERAKELHEKIIVFDTLIECSWYPGMLDNIRNGGGTAGSISLGTAGLENWRGLTENFTARSEDWWTSTSLVKDIAFLNRKAREHSDEIMVCLKADDIRTAKADGKIGFMVDVQNANFLGSSPWNLEYFKDLGLRRLQLTYNRQNFAGSGCMELNNHGLSIWGRELVERLNDLNMLVDTGHCMPQTVIEAAEVSSKPIACSHAGMASRVKNPRTQSDESIKKVADGGGVFGLVSTPGALNGTAHCTAQDYVDAIDAAVNLAGVEHVAFGTDLIMGASMQEILTAPEWGIKAAEAVGVDGDAVWPWSDGHIGMENNSGYPNLTRGLIAKGYKDDDIAKIMGGNYLRLLEDTVG